MEGEKRENISQSSDDSGKKYFFIDSNRIARLGDRLLALIIDSTVILAIFILAGMIITSQEGGFTESGFLLEGTPAILTFSITTLFAFLYFWLLEGLFGATFGKMIIGLKVVDKNGNKCNLKSSFIRNLLRLVDGIAVYLVGFLVAIFSKLRQRLGDHLANTVVVEIKQKGFIKAIAIAVWILIVVISLFFSIKIFYQFSESKAETESVIEDDTVFTEGDLKIINFTFLESKERNQRSVRTFKAGEKIYSKYDITGYTTDQDGRYELDVKISVYDPNELLVLTPWSTNVKQFPEKKGMPIAGTFNFDLPVYCPSGNYNIKFSVTDLVNHKTIESVEKFSVESEEIPIAEKLEVREFYFSKSEDGEPLENPVISPGETIYSKCKIAGMKFEDDLINVSIDLQVIDSKGKLLIDKTNLITINDEFIYHPRTFFQNISAWVSLPSNAVKGIYKWKYILKDNLADESTSYNSNFEVR